MQLKSIISNDTSHKTCVTARYRRLITSHTTTREKADLEKKMVSTEYYFSSSRVNSNRRIIITRVNRHPPRGGSHTAGRRSAPRRRRRGAPVCLVVQGRPRTNAVDASHHVPAAVVVVIRQCIKCTRERIT